MFGIHDLVLSSGRMDDVEDNSELRRGSPVAHTIYGVPQTINTANYVYFQAVQELLELQRGSKQADDVKGKGKGKETEENSQGDLIGLVTGKSFRSCTFCFHICLQLLNAFTP